MTDPSTEENLRLWEDIGRAQRMLGELRAACVVVCLLAVVAALGPVDWQPFVLAAIVLVALAPIIGRAQDPDPGEETVCGRCGRVRQLDDDSGWCQGCLWGPLPDRGGQPFKQEAVGLLALDHEARAVRAFGPDPGAWPAWTCGDCGQRNVGWALACGRCVEPRHLPVAKVNGYR